MIRRIRIRRILFLIAIIIVLPTLWYLAEREWLWSKGERDLAAAFAATAAIDPEWNHLNAGRYLPSDEANAAVVVNRVYSLAPHDWIDWEKPFDWEPDAPLSPPNQLDSKVVIDAAQASLVTAHEALVVARRLKDLPYGYRQTKLSPTLSVSDWPERQYARVATRLLRWDTDAAVAQGDRERCGNNLLALLNASRSLGDEPLLITQLIRMRLRSMAARTLERTLGRIELTEPQLAELQIAWARDSEEALILFGIRGERAAFDMYIGNLADGVIAPGAFMDRPGDNKDPYTQAAWWLYRGRMPGERALFHQWMTLAVAASRLPVHEQAAAFRSLPTPSSTDMKVARLFLPSLEKASLAYCQSVAEARCVVAALACERYRLKTGKWPEKLENVSADILPNVPLDSFDGQQLRYSVLNDGILIYSVWTNLTDDHGAISHGNDPNSLDEGIRLWNRSSRAVPAN